jgi:hypothetical protein
MGTCKRCQHFRKLLPASQLLSRAVGTADADIAKALTKVQEDEAQQRGYEAQTRVKREQSGVDEWGMTPVMSDYCGLKERDDIYLIAEIKNSGGRCTDFAAGEIEKHTCVTCRHRVVAAGPERDRAVEQRFQHMAVGNASAGMSTSTPDGLLSKHREGAASRRAFELSAIYSTKGEMLSVPLYFDHCAKLSTDGAYAVCAMRNPHGACEAWAAGAPAAAPAAPQPEPPAPPAPTEPDPEDCLWDFVDLCQKLVSRELHDDETDVIRSAVPADCADEGEARDWMIGPLADLNAEYVRQPTDARTAWLDRQLPQMVRMLRRKPWRVARIAVALYDAADQEPPVALDVEAPAAPPAPAPPPRRAAPPPVAPAPELVLEEYRGGDLLQMFRVAARNARRKVRWLQERITAAERAGERDVVDELHVELQDALNDEQQAQQRADAFAKMNRETKLNSIKNT